MGQWGRAQVAPGKGPARRSRGQGGVGHCDIPCGQAGGDWAGARRKSGPPSVTDRRIKRPRPSSVKAVPSDSGRPSTLHSEKLLKCGRTFLSSAWATSELTPEKLNTAVNQQPPAGSPAACAWPPAAWWLQRVGSARPSQTRGRGQGDRPGSPLGHRGCSHRSRTRARPRGARPGTRDRGPPRSWHRPSCSRWPWSAGVTPSVGSVTQALGRAASSLVCHAAFSPASPDPVAGRHSRRASIEGTGPPRASEKDLSLQVGTAVRPSVRRSF